MQNLVPHARIGPTQPERRDPSTWSRRHCAHSVVIFGFLDASYLAQERAYRDLYRAVVSKMRAAPYTINDGFETAAPLKSGARIVAFFSLSVAPVYLSLLALCGRTRARVDPVSRDRDDCNASIARQSGPATARVFCN